MAQRQHVIELNGKRYDALTGKQLGAESPKPVKKTVRVTAPQATKHLDGFSKRPRSAATPVAKKVHRQPEKSQTLMRTAVKKPATKKIHATTAATHTSQRPAPKPQPKISATIKPERIIRANAVSRSQLISKFGKVAPKIKTEVLAVKSAPTHLAEQKTPQTTTHSQKVAVPSSDPFKNALEQAESYVQHTHKKIRTHHKIARKLHVSPRIVSAAGITIVALGVGSFFAYQNLPELTMRVAATRAGLNASLPSYQPSGFRLAGPVNYEPGQVTLNYRSNSDDRSFNVVQKNSSWNSETLLENFVSTNNQPYQTIQANGRTIFIYEGNKATWVDGGIWYSIDGKANLNSDQLLRIATSL